MTWPFLWRRLLPLGVLLALLFLLTTGIAWGQEPGVDAPPEYRNLGLFGARIPVWIVAQLHLYFAAFILGVPIFSVVIEIIGTSTKNDRYDRLAKDFAKLLVTATAITALFGAIFLLLLTLCIHASSAIYPISLLPPLHSTGFCSSPSP